MSIWDDRPFRSPGQWYNLQVITSFLVIVGKCLNFVVFCLSSENFRQKLLVTLRARYNLQVITSFLVIVGKCLNFVVFCLSSENFRQKLLVTLRARCGGISEEK
ncbi:hypothetical protein ANCDUO_03122 [Ancylostoma duodenale]|uniref:G-protein coupled receptors family 1 profile domain-containing protein n=1 Tax=Ancylostoma duodenale TaxID=51022 RepID=A0A0C2HAN5_9BILA|nr:hypothetical protein ANCDUO_03122 [Ancylostoma duodenale]